MKNKESSSSPEIKSTEQDDRKVEFIITFGPQLLNSINKDNIAGDNSFFAKSLDHPYINEENLIIFMIGHSTLDPKVLKEASEILFAKNETGNRIINGLAKILGEVVEDLNKKDKSL